MKTMLPILLFILTASTASAQFTEKDQVVLGGNFNFYSQKDSSYNSNYLVKNNSFGVNIAVGKFIKKNVLSKFSVSFSTYDTKNIYSNNTISNPSVNFGIGYGRTWYRQLAKNFYFGIGGELQASYGTGKQKQSISNSETKTQSYSVSLGLQPQLAYQVSPRLVMNISTVNFLDLYYNRSETKKSSTPSASPVVAQTAGLLAGFWENPLSNLSFGFNYLLKKK